MTAYEIVGKITVEAMTVAIGISIGTSQLGGGDEQPKGGAEASAKEEVTFRGQARDRGLWRDDVRGERRADRRDHHDRDRGARSERSSGLRRSRIVLTALILYYIEFTGSGRFVRATVSCRSSSARL